MYIRTSNTRLLLDAGISGKQLHDRMLQVAGDELDAIQAVLITHEHVDHVRGLPQALKRSKASLYATDGTWHQLCKSQPDLAAAAFTTVARGKPFIVGDIRVTPFSVSHDAEEPVAYRFDAEGQSLAVVTDLGYVSDAIKDVIAGCQMYVFEANHDVEMLRAGRYPWHLKRRILGDKGHLSNADAAYALAELVAADETSVYLAHLSEENNQPDLAELTVRTILRDAKASYHEQIRIHRTGRTHATAHHIQRRSDIP